MEILLVTEKKQKVKVTIFIQQLWAFSWFSVTWFEIVKKKFSD